MGIGQDSYLCPAQFPSLKLSTRQPERLQSERAAFRCIERLLLITRVFLCRQVYVVAGLVWGEV